jgi:hypothetical protein
MDLHNVGALTPFDINNALDLADYCNRIDQDDDTVCIGRWIDDARKQGKHLYVSPGTYLFSDGKAIFKGFHLQCAGPTQAVFKAINNANDLFVLAPTWASESDAPWQDISIENCGFDLNGSTANFASVISLVGGTAPIQYVTVRGNIVYDSAQPGQMYTTRDRQRSTSLSSTLRTSSLKTTTSREVAASRWAGQGDASSSVTIPSTTSMTMVSPSWTRAAASPPTF